MKMKHMILGMAAGAMFAATFAATPAPAEEEMLIPSFVYRTGAYAPNGIIFANGMADYFALINAKGGINGIKVNLEECETAYKTDVGIECYEKMKDRATGVVPVSTGLAYAIMEKNVIDQIPLHTMGFGRSSAGDGTVFKYVFTFPTGYWSQSTAVIKYVGFREGGMANLKGKKIAHVYHNSAYGREINPVLEIMAKKFGFDLLLLPVDHPGQEQKSTWLQVRRQKPDWVFLSGWGVMNQVALKEAAAINFPMDHFVGNWWSSTESDVLPAGDAAKGYLGAAFHGVGPNWKVHDEIKSLVYAKGKGKGKEEEIGQVLYNRGMTMSMFLAEAMYTAMKKYGNKVLTGAELRWGLENLDLTAARLKEIGLDDFTNPVKVTCKDHETMGPVRFQQWDGKKWNIVSKWFTPMRDLVRPLIEEAAAKYAAEKGITPRKCDGTD